MNGLQAIVTARASSATPTTSPGWCSCASRWRSATTSTRSSRARRVNARRTAALSDSHTLVSVTPFAVISLDRERRGPCGIFFSSLAPCRARGSCPPPFPELGEDYLVYGFISDSLLGSEIETDRSPDVGGGYRMTNACQRPQRLAEAAADLEALDTITVVKPFAWAQVKAQCQRKSDSGATR